MKKDRKMNELMIMCKFLENLSGVSCLNLFEADQCDYYKKRNEYSVEQFLGWKRLKLMELYYYISSNLLYKVAF